MSKNDEMTRIGLSGTNWTGKTATIRRLVKTLDEESIDVVSLSSLVERCPHPMGKDQTLDGSKWMIEQVSEIVNKDPTKSLQIFDRTPLDILGFTRYIGYRCGTDEYKNASLKARNLLDRFDRIFFLRPQDQWLSDVNPPAEEAAFALLIDYFMKCEAESLDISLVELPWKVDKRVESIREFLDS